MEREIVELRKQIANASASANATAVANSHNLQQQQQQPSISTANQNSPPIPPQFSTPQRNVYQTPSNLTAEQYMGSHEAVASLLDLRSGIDSSYLKSPNNQVIVAKKLEDISVPPERVSELFNQ